MAKVAWGSRIKIDWDEQHRERSIVRIAGVKIPADKPNVRKRRALWEISTSYPRVFQNAYRWEFDSVAVNRGLRDGRGRTLIARSLDEDTRQMPLAVVGWHLPQPLTEPMLVIAASPRIHAAAGTVDGLSAVIDQGFDLLVDALLYVATKHRHWVLDRLSARSDKRAAEDRLGDLWFDVEGQAALETYLESLYGARLSVAAMRGSTRTRLRLTR